MPVGAFKVQALLRVVLAISVALPGSPVPMSAAADPSARPAGEIAGDVAPSRSIHSASSSPGELTAAWCAINSFAPGTLVVLADGSAVPIESLQVGDEVLATDPVTGETTGEPVVATITGSGVKGLVTITVTTDTGVAGEVTATEGHPFWVADRGVWVDAGDLLPGDWLRTSSGTWVQVSAVEHDHREQAVHNLTVDTVHTYYVYAGDAAVLSHNCGGGGNAVQAGIGGMDDVASYATQRLTTAGKGGSSQAHHLIEKRFSDVVGGDTSQWATVVLSRADHQLFTNAWRNAIGYGASGTGEATKSQVLDAARRIYANYPHILRTLGLG